MTGVVMGRKVVGRRAHGGNGLKVVQDAHKDAGLLRRVCAVQAEREY